MKYKLLTNEWKENYDDTLKHILLNRGIEPKDIKHYLNTTDKDINDFLLLGENQLKTAVSILISTIREKQDAIVIIDADCDGFTSSALLINYLYDLFPSWVENNLSWFIHEGKQHGLSDCCQKIIDENYSLVLVPDAGSNNYEEHKKLKEAGINTIILDHHEVLDISKDAIIINNQLSNYPNKKLSGVGIVWQFCRFIDELLKTDYANDYLDLVALGNTADVMSLKEIETKHLINKGFKKENIKNPFIYYMWQKNKFKLGEEITSWGAAFYIAPFVNAMVRSGTEKEKELLFESMLNFKAFNKVLSNKRGHLLGEMETIVEQSIRTCTNVKNRQSKAEKEGLDFLEKKIEKYNLLEHKILLFIVEKEDINKNIAGLIANKLSNKYQRPCCVLIRVKEDEEISYQGSARGYERGGLSDFKKICSTAPNVIYAEGHANAFGLGISGTKEEEFKGENLYQFIDYIDKSLKDLQNESIYYVDYIYENTNVNAQNILDIADMGHLWGKDIEEPLIAIERLKITKDMITLMSPDKMPTLKITLPNKVSIIKFGSSQEEYCKLYSEGYTTINLVGRCNKNEWNGNITPQIFIEDYEIVDSKAYYF